MRFHNVRFYFKYRKLLKKSFGCHPENARCIPSTVVIMTTADGKHPAFSGRHPIFLISDLYRSLPTSQGESRSALYPRYLKLKQASSNRLNVMTEIFPYFYHIIIISDTCTCRSVLPLGSHYSDIF